MVLRYGNVSMRFTRPENKTKKTQKNIDGGTQMTLIPSQLTFIFWFDPVFSLYGDISGLWA